MPFDIPFTIVYTWNAKCWYLIYTYYYHVHTVCKVGCHMSLICLSGSFFKGFSGFLKIESRSEVKLGPFFGLTRPISMDISAAASFLEIGQPWEPHFWADKKMIACSNVYINIGDQNLLKILRIDPQIGGAAVDQLHNCVNGFFTWNKN